MAPPKALSSGITTNKLTGERHIPASIRADGTQRREIRVRPGYSPPEDVELYKNRAAAAWKNRGNTGGVPGAEGMDDNSNPTTPGSYANSKNAKKREAKKRAKAVNEASLLDEKIESAAAEKGEIMEKDNWRSGYTQDNLTADGKQEDVTTQNAVDSEAEREKKARNLRKKLKQARELREKKDKGENLLPEQLGKIIRINELVRQLDGLGFDSEGQKKQKDENQDADINPGE